MKRRSLLLVGALSGLAATTGACFSGRERTELKFTNRLRVPPLAKAHPTADEVKHFSLDLLADGRSEFLPGLTTKTWGINRSYLGPTVRVARGDRVRMAVTNRLDEATTLHWHGMRLPAKMDGGPHQMIAQAAPGVRSGRSTKQPPPPGSTHTRMRRRPCTSTEAWPASS